MKTYTHALVAAGVLLSGSLMADVEIKLTGATAFRAAAYRAINTMFDAGTMSVSPSASDSKSQVTWKGKIAAKFGTEDVYVYASYSGSVKGIRAVLNNEDVAFVNLAGAALTAKADASFADNQPENTPFNASTLESVKLGVVPFIWVKNPHAAGGAIDNLTQQAANALYGGSLPMSMFTGNDVDAGVTVYVTGRAWTSGTRVIAASEIQYGPFTTASFNALDGSGNWQPADATLTLDNNQYGYGYGYEKGGDLKTAITSTAATEPAIGMMSVGEALSGTAIPTSRWLKYNGVSYTKAAVINGQYTYWSHERMVYKAGKNAAGSNFNKWYTSFTAKLAAELAADDPVTPIAIALGEMMVDRQADGGPIAP